MRIDFPRLRIAGVLTPWHGWLQVGGLWLAWKHPERCGVPLWYSQWLSGVRIGGWWLRAQRRPHGEVHR